METAVKSASARAQGDVDKFAQSIEDWFDARMDALSSLYKQWTRLIMLVIALLIAFVVDVNPIVAVALLRKDSALAATTADQAAAFVAKTGASFDNCPTLSATKTTTPTTTAASPTKHVADCYADTQKAFAQSQKLPPPLDFAHRWKGGDSWPEYIFGCLVGAVAISFGAPFWYDLLRKIISLRS